MLLFDHAVHHWHGRLFVTIIVTLVLAVASVVMPIHQPQANAAFGEGGSVDPQGNPSGVSSKYLGMIDWVDWSKGATPADLGILEKTEGYLLESRKTYGELNWDREDAGTIRQSKLWDKGSYNVQSETPLGDKKIATSCSLTNLMEDANGKPAPNISWLNIHIPGQYTTASGGGDGWDNVYQRFDKASRTGLPVGIGRAGGGRIRFDVKCRAEIIHKDHSRIPIPINGMVFADGETMTKGESAYIIPSKIDSTKPVNWRILEYHHAPGDPTHTELRLGPQRSHDRVFISPQGHQNLWQYSSLESSLVPEQALEMTVPSGVSSGDFQPFATMFASNTDGAYIDLRGGFGNYIAIGIVIGMDVGDGPASYGQAGAISQPDISDEESILKESMVRADSQPLAKVKQGAPPFLGKNGPDIDTHFSNKDSWTTLKNDDLTNSTSEDQYNDEDVFDHPLLITAQPGKFTQTVACQPAPGARPTNVSAWLDWNSDGRFSESERADAVCDTTSKSATLKWDVNERMLPPAGTSISRSLIRLIATLQSSNPQSADYFGPTGLVTSGEVEDHAVTLVRPTLSVHKRIVGSDGRDMPHATNDGFTFTASSALGTFFQKLPSALSPAQAEVKLLDIASTQTTSKERVGITEAGSVLWPLAFNHLPMQLTAQASQELTSEVTVAEEKIKPGFQFWPQGVSCMTPTASKAAWTHSIPVGDPKNGRTIEQAGTYAWPTPSSTEVTRTAQGFTVSMSPTSILDCSVSNQVFGQISIKPTVTFDSSLSSVPTLDDTLRFSGEFVCTPPSTAVSGSAEIAGTWGPVAKDEVWISNPGRDSIPTGSNCRVSQTAIASSAQQKMKDAAPSINGAYSWKSVQYKASNQITAGAVLVGEPLPQVTVENSVDETKPTTLSWMKVDESGRPLGGAEFRVWTSGRVATEEDIVREKISDCVADEPRGCAGMTDIDPREGYFTIPDAFIGDYFIEETQAPTGYLKTDKKLFGKIVRADLSNGKNAGKLMNVRVSSDVLPSLPMAGGLSTIVFVIVGMLALLISAIAGISSLRHRQGGATR